MSPACKGRGKRHLVYSWSLPPASFLDLGMWRKREEAEAGKIIVQLTKLLTPTALDAEAHPTGSGRGSKASYSFMPVMMGPPCLLGFLPFISLLAWALLDSCQLHTTCLR